MLKDFFNTNLSVDELTITLGAIRDFRECESYAESLVNTAESWRMTDVLEEVLAFMVEGQPMAQETMTQLNLF